MRTLTLGVLVIPALLPACGVAPATGAADGTPTPTPAPLRPGEITPQPVLQVVFTPISGPAVDVTGDALSAGHGTDGNQFEFDGTMWRFNLKIKNYSAEGTYAVSMVSGDTSEYVIDPACTGSFVID